jgi:DNA gyrase/topoisomerase IV subunit A
VRRTEILDARLDLTLGDMIPEEERVVTISHGGYAKTQPLRTRPSAVAVKASRRPASRMRTTSSTCWSPTATPRCCCSPARARCTG